LNLFQEVSFLEYVAIMRALSNMTVIVPADAIEAEKTTRTVADYKGPDYVRLGRGPIATVYHSDYPYRLGKAITLRDGKDVTIIATGEWYPEPSPPLKN